MWGEVMRRYFKMIKPDGSVSIFGSNNQMANLMYGKFVADKGAEMIEITKKEYKKIEGEIK